MPNMKIEIDGNDPRNVKGHVPKSLQAYYRRKGLIASAGDWYYAPCGSFALAPRHPASRHSNGRRKRIPLSPVARVA